MPWVGWLVIALLIALWTPVLGEWVAFAVFVLTAAPIWAGSALVHWASGAPAGVIEGPIGAGPRLSGWALGAEYWSLFKWPALAWLVAIAAVFFWIAARRQAGASVRAPINLLILMIGWPICFWSAMFAWPH
jgi:hypothetical protein